MYLPTPFYVTRVPMDVEYHIVTFGDPDVDRFIVTTVMKDGAVHDSYMSMRSDTPTGTTYFTLEYQKEK